MQIDDVTKKIIYKDSFGSKDTNYDNLEILTKGNISINDYLNYKTTEIKGIDDPNSIVKGKTISGSKKKVLEYFLTTSGFSPIEQLYIKGTNNTFSSSEKSAFQQYINSLGLSPDEQYEIYTKLKSIEELENGSIRWK